MDLKNSNYICDDSKNFSANFFDDIIYSNDDNNSTIACIIGIGHSVDSIQSYAITAISGLGLLSNVFLIFNLCISQKKNKKNAKKGSMKILFEILPIFDCFSAIYWILSSIKFNSAKRINEDRRICSYLSILYLSVLTIDFFYINILLRHFKKINNNPIDGTLKTGKNMFVYLLTSFASGIIISGIAFLFNILGRSPMVTCLINTQSSIFNALIFVPHLISLLYALFQVLGGLCCLKLFVYNEEIRNLYRRNCIYVLIFCLLHLPLFALIILSSFKDYFLDILSKEKIKMIVPLLIYLTTILSSMIPLIMSLSRLSQRLTKYECFYKIFGCCMNKNTKERLRTRNRYSMMNNFNRELSMTLTNDKDILDWMDQHVIEYFMRDILIGIAFSIKNSKKFEDDLNNLKIKKNFDTKKKIEHNINFLNYNLNDDTIKKSDFLDVNITEYAPKSFAFLRKEENIDIDEMIESFLPINNKEGIKESQGKSGSFFISTDDNKYMIKTLKEGEFHLLRESFLKQYIEYISENGDSLLCRLYGLYKLTMVKGKDFLLIVMRNVIGDYHKNITVKYDVKGCTYGRKVKIDDVPSYKIKNLTLKDINFIEMEKKIKLKEEYINPFVKSIRKDGQFLRQMKVMDYSLFLVKINLNDYEYSELFKNDSSKLEADSKNYVNVDIYDKMDTLSLNNLNLSLNVKSKNNYIHDCECFRIYMFPSTENNTAYILSIIDYFQSYNIKKKLESTYKVGIKGKDEETISCVDPDLYSNRFVKFMTKISGYKGSDNINNQGNKNLKGKDQILLEDYSDDDDDQDKLNIN